MTNKVFIAIVSFVLSCLSVAETNGQTVRGTVSGAGPAGSLEPLAGAYVIWAGTSYGTITDADGHFDLQTVGGADRLAVSYVGYRGDTLAYAGQAELDIVLRPITIEDVTVGARRVGSAMDRGSAFAQVNISADELCKAACCNLGESFETSASVDVNYADAATGAKTIQMLGLQGRYVQMMTENVPNLRGVASPFGLSYVPGPWMTGIQVSKGVGTVVNGYEALTGQINIEYKKPVATEEIASANLFGSSSGRMEANASVNAKVGPEWRTTFMVNASQDVMDMDENDDGFRDEPKVRQLNLFNRWYHHTDFHTFMLAVKTMNEKRVGGQVDFDDEKPVEGLYGVFVNSDRVEAWMKNGFVFSDEFNIGFPVGYTYHHQGSFFGDRLYRGTEHTYNFNSIANWTPTEMHELHAGVSSQGDFFNELADYGKGESRMEHDDISAGLYAQYTIKLPEDKFTAIVGLRYDHHNHYGNLLTPRLHLRWQPVEKTIVRAAAGKGYRGASVLAENNFLLTSKRDWRMESNYGMEKAWNFGINVMQYIPIGGKELSLNVEYYRTEFEEQMVTDMDYGARTLVAGFQGSRSYANTFQIEGKVSPVRGLDVTAAWRWNDNKLYLGGEKRSRPLVSKYKGLVAVSYLSPLRKWQMDANAQLCGGGRLPSTEANPEALRREATFGSYQMYNAQLTRWFKRWSIYGGVENIGNFMQEDPIVSAEDPSSAYFDSSMIWGPLMSRKFYLGVRWNIERKAQD